jgi:hypothetical protein
MLMLTFSAENEIDAHFVSYFIVLTEVSTPTSPFPGFNPGGTGWWSV